MIKVVNHPVDDTHMFPRWTAECKCGGAILFGKNKKELQKAFDEHVRDSK